MLRIGVLDPAALTRAESDMWLELMRGEDHGRAILRSAEGIEATAGAGARFTGAVRGLGVPKQADLGAATTRSCPPGATGERTRELAGAPPLHLVSGTALPPGGAAGRDRRARRTARGDGVVTRRSAGDAEPHVAGRAVGRVGAAGVDAVPVAVRRVAQIGAAAHDAACAGGGPGGFSTGLRR